MEWLTANWFFVFILVCCVGMHLFGHGHHGAKNDNGDSNN